MCHHAEILWAQNIKANFLKEGSKVRNLNLSRSTIRLPYKAWRASVLVENQDTDVRDWKFLLLLGYFILLGALPKIPPPLPVFEHPDRTRLS